MLPSQSPAIFTVSRLNQTVRLLLEHEMGQVWISGEISNFTQPASGHWYFTLKDDTAQVRCAMFRNSNRRVTFHPQHGQQVLVRANITLYEPRGDYQIIVESMQPAGEGLLQQKYEQLKAKLQAEGLFDLQYKKSLPSPAHCVGVITSKTGAALHDILHVLKRRDPSLPVIIYPTAVQGDDAPGQIVRAIELANKRNECDVLIVGRGGGSLEDLWSFNDERVARAIFASRIPIVSAVGHETDVTIADFVADLRAPTPSAAAEVVSRNQQELLRQVQSARQRLEMAMDFQKAERKPNACKDEQGRLRVGAAVGAGAGNEERVDALVAAGVDVLLIDSSHGHSEGVLQRIRETRAKYPDLQIIGGNVATAAGARALAEAGCSAVKVGIGPGSICTTRIVTGVGVPQITAVADAVEALEGTGIPVIADGGIRFSGDIAKAIAAGASAVMVGSMLAGTEESPGEIELYQGRSYKSYRGMGSLGAMSKGSSDRYFQSDNAADKLVPEGIEGRVAYKGRLKEIIHQQMGGLRSCMGLTGCGTIDELRTKAEFVRISGAGIQESHVHDVTITKESPNYRLGS